MAAGFLPRRRSEGGVLAAEARPEVPQARSEHAPELPLDEAGVVPAQLHELAVAALLDDPPAVEHQNAIGGYDGRQPMRHDEGGPASGQAVERPLHPMLGFGVERARSFVEHQDPRVLEERARDRDALPIARRKAASARAEPGLVALRELRHDVLDARGRDRRFELFPGRVGAPIGQIVLEGVVEEHGFLGHQTDLVAKPALAHVSQIVAVDDHAPLARIVEPLKERHHRRLPGAARTDDGDFLTGSHVEIEPVEDGAPGLVSEPDALEANLTPEPRRLDRVRRVRDLVVRVEELEEHLERDAGGAHGLVDRAEALYWAEEAPHVREERDERPGRDIAPKDQHSAEAQRGKAGHGDRQILQTGDRGVDDHTTFDHPVRGVRLVEEAMLLVLLTGEALHRQDAGEHFVEATVRAAPAVEEGTLPRYALGGR